MGAYLQLTQHEHPYQFCHAFLFSDKKSMAKQLYTKAYNKGHDTQFDPHAYAKRY